MVRTLKTVLFLSLISLFVLIPTVSSSEDTSPFITSYYNTYQLQPDKSVQVKHQITLTNKVSSLYVTEYSISIFHPNIKNIKVTNQTGSKIPFNLDKSQKLTTIKIKFPDQVIGINKSRQFTISYTDYDVAQQTGRVWEVNIPTLKNVNQTKDYTVKLIIPTKFPPILSSSPRLNKSKSLTWQKTDLLNEQGVKVIFGDYQNMVFNLDYFLTNDQDKPAYFYIALPPDTDYQKVVIENIEPKPVNVEIDADGNWLAKYFLDTNQSQKIKVKGDVWIFLKPKFKTSLYLSTPLSSWLKSTDFWTTQEPDIQNLANSFQSPRQAYKYVVDKLEYSYKRALDGPDRMGAIGALKNPDLAVCMEYTDLFISLMRSMKIPAREINGYAYTPNSVLKPLSLSTDVLHAWPEYYDQTSKRWRQVDPTWEDTTGGIDYFYNFDLNHFTFVIHGLNPYYPLPAGAYKDETKTTKDVDISFENKDLPFLSDIISIDIRNNFVINLINILTNSNQIQLDLKFINRAGHAVYLDNLRFNLLSNQVIVSKNNLPSKLILPPFSQTTKTIIIGLTDNKLDNLITLFRRNSLDLPYQVLYNQKSLTGLIHFKIDKQSNLITILTSFILVTLIFSLILLLLVRKLKQTRL